MGQTLTHGVYLPDEGERNCYDGLASNWNILDGAVGTVAEHTTQIAGKAPAVHTHTKSDITDFPAYGTTAGTICEGNDSRLSDARTPVAHTHTKSDVTDLFNSANTWSGYTTFTDYLVSKESAAIPAGGYGKGVAFQDYQSNRLGYIQPYLTSDNAKRLLIGADSGDVAINSNLIPHANNSYNLGTSTAKWKTLNGINPGALSLPDGRTSAATTIDITDWYVQDPNYPDDPTKKILDATEQTLSSNICGWVEISFTNAVGNYAYARRWQTGTNMHTYIMADGNSDFNQATLIFPIDTGGLKVRIKAKSATVKIYPCQGNV